MQTRINNAISLANKGLYIFPLKPGSKKPFSGKSWLELMTQDSDVIKKWFLKAPDMNYGVCPGDSYAVIDLDINEMKNGLSVFNGLESVEDLDNWISGNTFTVTSPSGGKHLYIRVDEPVGNAHSFPPKSGIDIRGSSGYVVGPGCTLNELLVENDYGGSYTIDVDSGIIPAPNWIKTRLGKNVEKDELKDIPAIKLDLPENIRRSKEYLRKIEPAIEGQGGNDHTFKVICQIRDYGISMEKCVDILSSKGGWNDRCNPPWGILELQEIVEHSYRYGQNRSGSKGSLLDVAGNLFDTVIEESNQTIESNSVGLDSITFLGSEIAQRDVRREYIIPEWVLAHGYTIMLAKRACGKTTFMMDMALRAATDMDWHGLPIKEGLVSIYLCGEDDLGLTEQYKAWVQMHDIEPESDRLVIMAGIVDIMDANDTAKWTEHLMKIVGNRKAIVFLDTWQRANARGNQNDDGDVQIAVQHVEAMAKSLNGPAIVACHPPKNDESALTVIGSSLMENASAGILTITDVNNGKEIKVTRIKGKGYGNYRVMKFEELKLGEMDEFGQERTGVVPLKIAGTELGGKIEKDHNHENRIIILADFIKNMDLYRKSVHPEIKSYSISSLSKFLESFYNKLYEDDRLEDIGREVVKKLRGAGMVSASHRGTREMLTNMFTVDPRGYSYGDGYCLRARRDGQAFRFYIERGV